MTLRTRGRSVLTAHLEQAHREPHHIPDHAVATDWLDARMTAVPPRQLDGVRVRPAHLHRIVELLYAHGV